VEKAACGKKIGKAEIKPISTIPFAFFQYKGQEFKSEEQKKNIQACPAGGLLASPARLLLGELAILSSFAFQPTSYNPTIVKSN